VSRISRLACDELSRVENAPTHNLTDVFWIARKFCLKVKELVGGAKGCAHLVALPVSMASAAVQGAWTAVSRRPAEQSGYRERAMEAIVDTCRVWRKDGPKFKTHLK